MTQSVILAVNEYGDLVEFSLNAARGDGQSIFWAFAGSKAYHCHRRSLASEETKKFLMSYAGIGAPLYPDPRLAALSCSYCNLRIVLPEDGMSSAEILEYFKRWNPRPLKKIKLLSDSYGYYWIDW